MKESTLSLTANSPSTPNWTGSSDWTEIFRATKEQIVVASNSSLPTNLNCSYDEDFKHFDLIDNAFSSIGTDVRKYVMEAEKELAAVQRRALLTPKMHEAINASIVDFRDLIISEVEWSHKRLAASKNRQNSIAQDLDNFGISLHKLEAASTERLASYVPRYGEELKVERMRQGAYVAPISLPRFDRLFIEAVSVARNLGIIDAASEYLGSDVTPIYVAVQESTSEESWWINPLGSNGLEYQHFDYDFDMLKTIIYLTDVSDNNGPFKFVRGSTNIPISKTWLAFYKSFEKRLQQAYGQKMGKDGNYYYRTRYLSQEFLQDAAALPRHFLGVSHFGDDISPTSDNHIILSDSECSVLSSNANCFIFDGSRLIHRGGMVQQGHRVALQIGLIKTNSINQSWLGRGISTARQYARSLVKGK